MADIPRIKGNIEKMIAQGAPEAEIDAYVAGEGVTLPELKGVKPETMGSDAYKSLDAGVAKGTATLLGSVGDLTNLGAKGIEKASNYISDKIGIARYERPQGPSLLDKIPTSASMEKEIQSRYYNNEAPYEPQFKTGKVAYKAGEFAPSVAIGPGGLVSKALATAGGGAGAEYGGDIAERFVGKEARPYGEFAGGFAGALSPNVAARAVTPFPTSPARQRLVDILTDEGVTSLTAGQRTGNKSLQYMEDVLGNSPGAGQSAANITREGQEQFTRAAMRRAGHGLEDAAPEAIAANNARLGNQFEELSMRNTLHPDNQLITDLVGAVRPYRNVPPSQQRATVQGYVDDIVEHINNGSMTGAEYQKMRSRLSGQSHRLRDSDPDLAEALRGMRNALDDAMGRSIVGPDQALWQQSRREWGAQKNIEKSVSRAGELSQEGQIVPANLRNTVSANNRGAFARGEGDFSELARAGSGVMAPLPNSGTAQRNLSTDILKLPLTATIGRALMSAPVQGYAGNQVLARAIENLPPGRQALLRALIAEKPELLSGPSQ
jgi:hypothetical protein